MNAPTTITQGKPWHLLGNWAPVADEIDVAPLTVRGTIPAELDGTYVRNGMNPKSGASDHWFAGTGMLQDRKSVV